MRGKVNRTRKLPVVSGITPAYAGKRQVINFMGALYKDHPRVCGEKTVQVALLDQGAGSPPRMRGKD